MVKENSQDIFSVMRDPAAFAALVSLAQEYAASVHHEIDVIAGLGKLGNRQNTRAHLPLFFSDLNCLDKTSILSGVNVANEVLSACICVDLAIR
jgi:hypothetical protein